MPQILINIPDKSTPQKTLGARLRLIRIARGLTQRQISEAIGITKDTAYRMEGGHSMDAVIVARWVQHCGQDLDSILSAIGG